jgi:hypothetical protein
VLVEYFKALVEETEENKESLQSGLWELTRDSKLAPIAYSSEALPLEPPGYVIANIFHARLYRYTTSPVSFATPLSFIYTFLLLCSLHAHYYHRHSVQFLPRRFSSLTRLLNWGLDNIFCAVTNQRSYLTGLANPEE